MSGSKSSGRKKQSKLQYRTKRVPLSQSSKGAPTRRSKKYGHSRKLTDRLKRSLQVGIRLTAPGQLQSSSNVKELCWLHSRFEQASKMLFANSSVDNWATIVQLLDLEMKVLDEISGSFDEQRANELATAQEDYAVCKSWVQSYIDQKGTGAIEALSDEANGFDREQLCLIALKAKERDRLLREHSFVDIEDFLIQAPLLNSDSNQSRTLNKLRNSNEVLTLRTKGRDLFPVFQIDPNTGDVYEELKPVLRKAFAQGYRDQEIIGWLSSPYPTAFEETPGRPVTSGDISKPIDMESVLEQIERLPETDYIPMQQPLDLLHSYDNEGFSYMSRQWLGTDNQ